MGRTATTWQLMKDSWGVLMRDKELLAFPLASGIACLLVLVMFAVPALGVGVAGARGAFRGGGGELAGYALLFCWYLANFFVVFYFNAALVDFVLTRIAGGEPTLRGSLRAAAECLPQIAAWAFLSATVGVVLNALQSRAGFVGRLVVSVIGFAWTLVTYFVVPVIVNERKGALEAVGESKDLLGRTWGRQIVSGLAYGLIWFLLALPAFAAIFLAVVGAIVSQGHGAGSWGSLAALAVVYLIVLGIVLSALRSIFGAVLYRYAKTGHAPDGFAESDLRAAMRPA